MQEWVGQSNHVIRLFRSFTTIIIVVILILVLCDIIIISFRRRRPRIHLFLIFLIFWLSSYPLIKQIRNSHSFLRLTVLFLY